MCFSIMCSYVQIKVTTLVQQFSLDKANISAYRPHKFFTVKHVSQRIFTGQEANFGLFIRKKSAVDHAPLDYISETNHHIHETTTSYRQYLAS